MNNRIANYCVVESNGYFVVIADLGPWTKYPTITNSAKGIIAKMYEDGVKDQKIIYYDSNNQLTELKHDGKGHFRAFAHINEYPFVLDGDVCSD